MLVIPLSLAAYIGLIPFEIALWGPTYFECIVYRALFHVRACQMHDRINTILMLSESRKF